MRETTAAGIFSGRLWSVAGRQVRSISGSPARRVSATSSGASAPQPMMRGRRRWLLGDARTTFLHQRACGFDGDGRVPAVGIGAHGLAELLVQRRTADEDDVVVA